MTDRILIIDDDKDLTLLLEDELSELGYEVYVASDGEKGVELSRDNPSLILLDIMMPKMNGYDVCRRIREEVDCPILFLSAKQSEMDKIRALKLGGDDFITKPFGLREVIARIEANLRREKRGRENLVQEKNEDIVFGKLHLDIRGREVAINNRSIELTKKEYDIVEILALHPGQVFSREQIYENVWGYDALGDNTTVVEHIKKIRAKFEAADKISEYITTVWGIGYKWKINH